MRTRRWSPRAGAPTAASRARSARCRPARPTASGLLAPGPRQRGGAGAGRRRRWSGCARSPARAGLIVCDSACGQPQDARPDRRRRAAVRRAAAGLQRVPRAVHRRGRPPARCEPLRLRRRRASAACPPTQRTRFTRRAARLDAHRPRRRPRAARSRRLHPLLRGGAARSPPPASARWPRPKTQLARVAARPRRPLLQDPQARRRRVAQIIGAQHRPA